MLKTILNIIIYFSDLTDNLPNAYIAGQKLFFIQGDHYQSFHWDECGLRLSCPKGALSSSDERCEVAIVALAGGQFKLPVGTKLVSAVYGISVRKPLLKPLTLELQHCVTLETKAQADCLVFARAPLVGCDPNTEFKIMEGGEFYPGSWYGSITRYHFCVCGIVKSVCAKAIIMQEEYQSIGKHIGISILYVYIYIFLMHIIYHNVDTDHQFVTADRIDHEHVQLAGILQ